MSETSNLPKCDCGHDRNSHFTQVEKISQYTAWGWFWLLFGISARPIKTSFKCYKCKKTFDEVQGSTTY